MNFERSRPVLNTEFTMRYWWCLGLCLFLTSCANKKYGAHPPYPTSGQVLVNGQPAKPHRVLRVGDEIEISRPLGRKQRLVVRRLAGLPNALCAAPEYLHGRDSPVCPDDLPDHVCLLDRQHYPKGWQFCGATGAIAPVRVCPLRSVQS